MTNSISNQAPTVFIKTSGVFTGDGSLVVPAAFQIMSVIIRETNNLKIPAGLNVGTTNGGSQVFGGAALSILANDLRSTGVPVAGVTQLPNWTLAVFSATVDTPIYFTSATAAITGITQANPAVVTYSGADVFANGQTVDFSGIVGMTELNGTQAVIANLNTGANTFELSGVDATGFTAYSSGGIIGGWNGASLSITMQLAQFD